ncbi:MAG: UDP-N-acetylmuramoyl-L-alanyl-D-glutamate--2,6-diaminopimelate ligase [Candidatus Tyrphobacter sp.]
MSAAGEGVALAALLARLPHARIRGDANARIERIATDSREAGPSALFVALEGERADGHLFVAEALANGAAAVVVDRGRARDVPDGTTVVEVESTRRALSSLAAALYRDPSHALTVVGVTGTNGKTTTTHMVAAIASEAGLACGIVGTIGASFGRRSWSLAHTTPFPNELHAILAEMAALGARAVAMEVSSHALALQRVDDVRFACAALTNVTRDHLDFHGTREAYAAAKRRLFSLSARAVINNDDAYGARWADELREALPLQTFAIEASADIRPNEVRTTVAGSTFTLDGREFSLALVGRFNVANALAAIGCARAVGIADEHARDALASLRRVPGRMDRLTGSGVEVVVDYAHTPDALEHALQALRETAAGHVAVVFGCGGDRDRGKRAEMGALAARYADRIYVTSDNPRHEDPAAIAAEIVAGIGTAPHVLELDRRTAIARAVREAAAGDVVLVAGKGHETYQIVGDRRLRFDDAEVAEESLRARAR